MCVSDGVVRKYSPVNDQLIAKIMCCVMKMHPCKLWEYDCLVLTLY